MPIRTMLILNRELPARQLLDQPLLAGDLVVGKVEGVNIQPGMTKLFVKWHPDIEVGTAIGGRDGTNT